MKTDKTSNVLKSVLGTDLRPVDISAVVDYVECVDVDSTNNNNTFYMCLAGISVSLCSSRCQFEIRQLRAHLAQQDLDLAAEREAAMQIHHVWGKQSSSFQEIDGLGPAGSDKHTREPRPAPGTSPVPVFLLSQLKSSDLYTCATKMSLVTFSTVLYQLHHFV